MSHKANSNNLMRLFDMTTSVAAYQPRVIKTRMILSPYHVPQGYQNLWVVPSPVDAHSLTPCTQTA